MEQRLESFSQRARAALEYEERFGETTQPP